MKQLPLCLLLALGSCRVAPLAPSARAVPEPKPWRAVSVVASSTVDSLVFTVRTEGEPRQLLSYGLGLNTDGDESTGAPYAGGPDYVAGFPYYSFMSALGHVILRWPTLVEQVADVSWTERGDVHRLAIAWHDLPRPLVSGLPWKLELYTGAWTIGYEWQGMWEGTLRVPVRVRRWPS